MAFETIFHLIYFSFDFCWFLVVAVINIMNFLILSMIFLIFIAKVVCLFRQSSQKHQIFTDSIPMIIAHQGGNLDVEPNTMASIQYVQKNNISNILVNLNMTLDGKLVVLDDESLLRSNVEKSIDEMSLNDIKKAIKSNANGQGDANILTLENFMNFINTSRMKAFMMSRRIDGKFIEVLQKNLQARKELDVSNIIFCSQSLFSIYKLRKNFADMNLGLWIDPIDKIPSLKSITVPIQFIYGLILKHAIIPLLEIQCIFVKKGDFDSQLFKTKRTIQITYFINSTIEKIHYQENMKVEAYLTESLRSEPKNIGWKTSL